MRFCLRGRVSHWKRLKKDTDRDFFMSAHEAKDYGIVDEVIVSRK